MKIVIVAIREYIETVKTKTFLVSSILLPLVMIGVIFGTEKIAEISEREKAPTRNIAVVDLSGVVFDKLASTIEQHNAENPQRPMALEHVAGGGSDQIDDLRARVDSGELYAYLIVPAEVTEVPKPDDGDKSLGSSTQPAPVEGDLDRSIGQADELATTMASALEAGNRPGADQQQAPAVAQPAVGECEFGRKDSRLEIQRAVQDMLNGAVTAVRFERADPPIDIERVQRMQTPVKLRDFDVKSGQDTSGNELIRFMTPFAFMFLLFMGTMTISQGLLTSVIEEKSSRVVEVLLSAVSPTQLMAGKILGMVSVGATLMSIWGIVGFASAHAHGMGYLVTPHRLIFVVLYFVPGFLLFSAFLAAVGAACNSLKEAQSMAAPLTLMTIVPMMLWWNISQNPDSTLSVVLSFIPPITPFVMILRICANPEISMMQVAATLALLWLAVVGTIWFSGKVFRVGVLMYGKPPSLRELIHWLRYS